MNVSIRNLGKLSLGSPHTAHVDALDLSDSLQPNRKTHTGGQNIFPNI